MNKKELSAYMSALGKVGNKALQEKKLKEDPNYFVNLAKKSWIKRRKNKADKEAADKSV